MTGDSPLSAEQLTEVLERIMAGQLGDEEIAQLLAAMAKRGETAEEIAAAVRVLRAHAVALPLSKTNDLCDTCGTGGDAQHTINISTLAAIVAAADGVRIVKHGNRAASSRCGSADLVEALGLNLHATPAQVARCIDQLGFGFCFAPMFHPAMKAVAAARKALGIRTVFNLVGPLANPAPLTYQLVGVSDARLLYPMAEALIRLGVRRGLVVHGQDGLDEVTTTGQTEALEVQEGRSTRVTIDPVVSGVPRASLESLRGGDAMQNAAIARAVLGGIPSAAADIVALNAGCVLYVAGRTDTIAQGVVRARAVLAARRGLELVERVARMTHA